MGLASGSLCTVKRSASKFRKYDSGAGSSVESSSQRGGASLSASASSLSADRAVWQLPDSPAAPDAHELALITSGWIRQKKKSSFRTRSGGTKLSPRSTVPHPEMLTSIVKQHAPTARSNAAIAGRQAGCLVAASSAARRVSPPSCVEVKPQVPRFRR